MSKRKEEKANLDRLSASLNHRLLSVPSRLRPFDRAVKAVLTTKVGWACADDTYLMMNVEDLNPLGEINCPDSYRKDLKKRDRLWDWILGRKRGS